MSGIDVALADTDPAAFVLAVADLRERRARVLPGWELEETDDGHEIRLLPEDHSGSYEVQFTSIEYTHGLAYGFEDNDHQYEQALTIIEHVFGEANPDHALAEVALWRGAIERHEPYECGDRSLILRCRNCVGDEVYDNGVAVHREWPCPDLRAVVAAAKAYLAGVA